MKIKQVNTFTTFYIIVEDDGEFTDYERVGPDNWMVRMGESMEPVYDCDELESLFQEYQELSSVP